MYRKTFSALALILTISLAGVSPASAAKPLHHHTEAFNHSGIDEFASQLCGFEISFQVQGRENVKVNADGSLAVQEHSTLELTNTGNGKTVTMFRSMNATFNGTESVSDDGILTIEFNDVFNGIRERWIGPDGRELAKDAGRAIITGTVVIDLNTDELISFEESFEVHGPHPLLLGDSGSAERLCELVG